MEDRPSQTAAAKIRLIPDLEGDGDGRRTDGRAAPGLQGRKLMFVEEFERMVMHVLTRLGAKREDSARGIRVLGRGTVLRIETC